MPCPASFDAEFPLTCFGMVLEPGTVVGGVVENDVHHSEHPPLSLDPLHPAPDGCDLDVGLGPGVEEVVGERKLVEDRVGRARLATLLERRVVDHVVASVAHEVKVRRPLSERSHPLCDDGLDDEPIEREADALLRDGSSDAGREDGEVGGEDGSAGGEGEDGFDAEVARAAALAERRRRRSTGRSRRVVLYKVLERSGFGDLGSRQQASARPTELSEERSPTGKSISKGLLKFWGRLQSAQEQD